MAKIKIAGYSELITVSQSEAQKINAIKNDISKPNDHTISLKNLSISKGDIKGVFLDEEITDQGADHLEALKQYYKERDAIVALSPKERALKTIPQFKFFLNGVKKLKEYESLKDEYLKKAEAFFVNNPLWAKCSTLVMYDLVGKLPMESNHARILERVEVAELNDVRQSERFNKAVQASEKKTNDVLVGITEADLPF